MKKYGIIIVGLIFTFLLLILFSLPSAVVARFDKLKVDNPLLKDSKLEVTFFTTFPNLRFDISNIASPDGSLQAEKASFEASIFKLLSSRKLYLDIFLEGASIDLANLNLAFLNNGSEASEEGSQNKEVRNGGERFKIYKVDIRNSYIKYKDLEIKGVIGTLKLNADKKKDTIDYYDLILHGVLPSSAPIQAVARVNVDSAANLVGVDEARFVFREELTLKLNTALSYADNLTISSPIIASVNADNASIEKLGGVIKPFFPNFNYFDNATSGTLSMKLNATYDKKITNLEAEFDIKNIASRSKYLEIDNGAASFRGNNLKLDNISFSLFGAKGTLNGNITGVKEAVLEGKDLGGNVKIIGDNFNFDKFMQDSIDQNEANLKESKRESTHSVKIIYFDHFEKSEINLRAYFNTVNMLGGTLKEVEFRGFIWNGAIHLDDFSSKKVSAEIGVR